MVVDIALILLVLYLVLDVGGARKEARENWSALAKQMENIRWERGVRRASAPEEAATDYPE